ncbi:hypothetical protein [Phenylobacterium kunshanense]|uniref:Uncharacterized protein n=1 Tax=Phenylobacterium kunshanense TaxID=1445034 RepID=A0A328BIK0_9CAUL|nr:hypothetical protein [Phenylobacterium kunshanense]RAK66459.1 hypothetical protein DJ019_09460 [Phenylobacterium kunshanense]
MQEPEVVLARLGAAFGDQPHDLRLHGRVNVAPDRREWIEGLLAAGMDRLSPADLDMLVYRAISTVGGTPTFKFALSRFLAVMLLEPAFGAGAVSDAFVILPKLDHARFEAWPEEERRAILEALELWAERRLTADPADVPAAALRTWVETRRDIG